jgi:(+)-trans-carveol dehydrogenase
MGGKLDGQVVFITGAARGQGRSHAVRFAQEGAKIIAVDACTNIPEVPYPLGTEDDLKETVRLVEEFGGSIVASVADVRDRDALSESVADGVEKFGRLDIVLANAGINSPSPGGISESGWQVVLDINLTGVWRTVDVAIPHILAGGLGGCLILTSSAAGLKGYPNIAHYTAAKHGVNGLMKTLALELASKRVRVNTLNPTQVDTPMIMNDPMFRLFCPDIPNATRTEFAPVSQAMNALPIPWVDPVDVSNAALFLASEEGRYITGVALPVDAGVLIK